MTSTGPLVVTGLRASHGSIEVLRQVDLIVGSRQLACVLGPSGCGKTTLLRAIAGFHRPTGGEILLGGQLLDDARKHVPPDRRRVGYIPQDVALFPHLDVAANIGFGLPRRGRRARVEELLDLIRLDGHAGRHPHELSGGQQQRVALARALAPGPALLLLDEPFSALDASLRDRVRNDVADLLRGTGTAAVLVTHDADEAMAFADVITVLADGEVLQTGSPHELFTTPRTAGVATALGEANLLSATLGDRVAETALGTVPVSNTDVTSDGQVVVVRPHLVEILTDPRPGDTPATVRSSRFRGDRYRFELVVEHRDAPVIAYGMAPFSDGHRVFLHLTGAAHVVAGDADRPTPAPSVRR